MITYKYTFELEGDNKVIIEASSRMNIKDTLKKDWCLGEKTDGSGSTVINMNKVIALYEEIIKTDRNYRSYRDYSKKRKHYGVIQIYL